MIEIETRWVDDVRRAERPSDLHDLLQKALELEHATVPLYLTALFSLVPGTNEEIAATLRSVVREEMLHFAIVANVVTALGGRPVIDDACVVPTYPGELPMGVAGGLRLHLDRMSIDQCRDFVTVEAPDDPVTRGAASGTTTIGDFYAAIIDKIRELGDAGFGNPSAPQVVSPWFRSDQLFAITDVASATRALELVVRQGEGTSASPFEEDGTGELAHFYQFSEIVEKKRLAVDRAGRYRYIGAPVVLDTANVYALQRDPEPPPGTDGEAVLLSSEFDACYRRLLACLQTAFDGRPDALGAAMGLMFELRVAALAMITSPVPAGGTTPHPGLALPAVRRRRRLSAGTGRRAGPRARWRYCAA